MPSSAVIFAHPLSGSKICGCLPKLNANDDRKRIELVRLENLSRSGEISAIFDAGAGLWKVSGAVTREF